MCLRSCQLTEIWIGWDIVWLDGECILLLLSSMTVERVMVIVKMMIAKSSSILQSYSSSYFFDTLIQFTQIMLSKKLFLDIEQMSTLVKSYALAIRKFY